MMVNEIVEFVTAIAFLVNLLLCYYGPNATLIANIKSSYFHNKPIASIDIFFANLLYRQNQTVYMNIFSGFKFDLLPITTPLL